MQSNVLILTYWSFGDALIQSYTLPYLRIIRRQLPRDARLVLFTLEKISPDAAAEERIRKQLQVDSIEWMYGRYFPFGLRAVVEWGRLIVQLRLAMKRFALDSIHCWGTPAGAIGLLLSVLTGKRLIVDSFEPHAEAMVENGTWRRSGLAFRLLFFLEEWQARKAQVLIAANSGMRQYAKEKYGVDIREMLVKPACVDLDQFNPITAKDEGLALELSLAGKVVAVYAGKLGGIYLDKEVFDFLKAAYDRWGDRFRALLLTGHSEKEIESFCTSAGLDRAIVVTRFVPHHEVPRYLTLADFALTPVKPVPTKRYCTPIKDGEYWAMGLPVVIPAGISDDSAIIQQEGIGAVLDSLTAESYRAALDTIESLLALPRDERLRKIREVAFRYRNFNIAEAVYRQVYGR